MIAIETDRLYFREIFESDDRSILELDSDPAVHQYLGNHSIKDIIQARDLIQFIRQQYVDNGIGRLAIIEKETDNFVGWGGFKLITNLINGHRNYHDLGYRFIKRYWGKGYATESSKAAIEFGFNKLELPVIYAIADTNNIQSKKVLEKCGFRCKETFYYENTPHYWFELKNKIENRLYS
jgi:RimJ/RimL family protein N-acetyltransferase